MDEIINYFSHYFEEFEKGTNPIAGQIFGLLIQSPEPVSLTELAEKLNLSKAAISIQVRILNSLGYCIKLPRRKDRKDYYKINEHFLEQVCRNKIQKHKFYLEELGRIHSSLDKKNEYIRKNTGDIIAFLKLQIENQEDMLSYLLGDGKNTDQNRSGSD